jgi:hypothetical protein
MQTSPLTSLGMNESAWNQYRIDDPYFHNETDLIPGMKRYCFQVITDNRKATLGLYEHQGEHVLKAWGYGDEEHCSYHAIKVNGAWSEVIEGCPDFKIINNGFTLTHKKVHVWSGDTYYEEELPTTCQIAEKKSLSLVDKTRLYAPLIYTALLSFAFGGALTLFQMFSLEMFLMNSMGVFITILGLLKMKDVSKFALMFKQYDPIAGRIAPYAKLYPFIELGIGLLILSGLFVITTQLAVIFIYTATTIGIFSSLNKEKELECGCLGSSVKLPLSKVTVFENLAMVLMAIYVLIGFVRWG